MSIFRFLKAMGYWILPRGIYNLLGIIKREFSKDLWGAIKSEISQHFFDRDYRKQVAFLVRRNVIFKDKHFGERCFILATGPSVRGQELTGLKDELCIAVSEFYFHKDINIIAPRYHVVAPCHSPSTFAELKQMFEALQKAYSSKPTFFFGYRPFQYSTFDFLEEQKEYRPQDYHFLNYFPTVQIDENNCFDEKIWDISRSLFDVNTVVFCAIQVALYMGVKEIYLIGCDHDYLLNMTRVTNHHFYKEEDGISEREHLSSFDSERWFGEYYYRWMRYRLMREYAKRKGCMIFNATKGGMLDVFPRVDLESVIGARDKKV